MSIYSEAIQAVSDGARFNVSFEDRSLRINKKYLIRNGEYEGVLGSELCSNKTTQEALSFIEEYYDRYKNSTPSERSEGKRRKYFKALREKDISDDDFIYGMDRNVAQLELELIVLFFIMDGVLKWNEEIMGGKWFWQSDKDMDLVILRNWVEPKQKAIK